ncbi:unnamed protein product [Calypogeia fissa]
MVLCEPERLLSRSMFNSHSRKIRKVSPDKGVRRTMLAIQGQSNSSTPCAACKLLRRRCAQECPFSPYFSPHEPQKFACVHKIYGASNVSKMLMEVPESQRADAASSLVYEANARLRDPVYGCLGAISALQQQLESLQTELNAVRDACTMQQQALMRKTMEHNQNVVPSSQAALMGYGSQNQNDRLSGVSGGLPTLTTIFPPHHNERLSGGSGSLSNPTVTSPDYTVPSPNAVGTPEVKERYWTSMN